MLKFSVVVPTYNNAINLPDLFNKIRDLFIETQFHFEVIFIDDNSIDNTWETIKKLKSNFPKKIKGAKLKKNSGQQNATLCGFMLSTGHFIITIDDDLQMPPSEIMKLISKQKEESFDIVYGSFIKKQHSIIKNFGSYFIQSLQKKIFKTLYGFSGFRLIKRAVIEEVISFHGKIIFLDTILMSYSKKRGFVKVLHQKRKAGIPTYTYVKLISIFLDFIKSISYPLFNHRKKKQLTYSTPFDIEKII